MISVESRPFDGDLHLSILQPRSDDVVKACSPGFAIIEVLIPLQHLSGQGVPKIVEFPHEKVGSTTGYFASFSTKLLIS